MAYEPVLTSDLSNTQTQLLNEILKVLSMPNPAAYVFPAYIGLPPYNDTKDDILYQILLKLVGGSIALQTSGYKYFSKVISTHLSSSDDVIDDGVTFSMFTNAVIEAPAAPGGELIGINWDNLYGTKIRVTVACHIVDAIAFGGAPHDDIGGGAPPDPFASRLLIRFDGVIKTNNDSTSDSVFNKEDSEICWTVDSYDGLGVQAGDVSTMNEITDFKLIESANIFTFQRIDHGGTQFFAFNFYMLHKYIHDRLGSFNLPGEVQVTSLIGVEVQPYVTPG